VRRGSHLLLTIVESGPRLYRRPTIVVVGCNPQVISQSTWGNQRDGRASQTTHAQLIACRVSSAHTSLHPESGGLALRPPHHSNTPTRTPHIACALEFC